jgi:hypothetical protein
MHDISELLTAEAVRQQPADQPPFAELLQTRIRRQRRNRLAAGAALAVLATAGGASMMVPASAPDNPGDTVRAPAGLRSDPVTVTGSLQWVGGPPDTPPRGVPGTVRFRADDGTITPTTTSGDGRFTVTVTAGRYVVTGTPGPGDPQQPPTCRAETPVTVPADGLTGVEVNCHIR